MSDAMPFGEWLEGQGDDVRLAMCDGHPNVLILVDRTNLAVYRYVLATNQEGVSEELCELARVRLGELGIGVVD